MKHILFALIFALLFNCGLNTEMPPYYRLNEKLPGEIPVRFAPGVITTANHEHSAPAISPAGDEIYWSVWEKPTPENPVQKILFMRYTETGWSRPKVAAFSGTYTEGGPTFSADGKKLFFYSRRPVHRDSSLNDDIDLWYVEKYKDSWSDAKHVSPVINNEKLQAAPSLSKNNNLYFINFLENVKQNYGIFKSVYQNGHYSKPVALPETINSIDRDWTPYIAPDESYLIFSSHRPGGFGSGDLYISFKNEKGGCSDAINLGDKINTASQERFPMVSPDGKILFFTRATEDAYDDIFWVQTNIIFDIKKSLDL